MSNAKLYHFCRSSPFQLVLSVNWQECQQWLAMNSVKFLTRCHLEETKGQSTHYIVHVQLT